MDAEATKRVTEIQEFHKRVQAQIEKAISVTKAKQPNIASKLMESHGEGHYNEYPKSKDIQEVL